MPGPGGRLPGADPGRASRWALLVIDSACDTPVSRSGVLFLCFFLFRLRDTLLLHVSIHLPVAYRTIKANRTSPSSQSSQSQCRTFAAAVAMNLSGLARTLGPRPVRTTIAFVVSPTLALCCQKRTCIFRDGFNECRRSRWSLSGDYRAQMIRAWKRADWRGKRAGYHESEPLYG